MSSDDGFRAKTEQALAANVADARATRRSCDKAGCRCRHCTEYTRLHACIDDHLDQLLSDDEPAPIDARTATLALQVAHGNPATLHCTMCHAYRPVIHTGEAAADTIRGCPNCDTP